MIVKMHERCHVERLPVRQNKTQNKFKNRTVNECHILFKRDVLGSFHLAETVVFPNSSGFRI